MADKVKIKTDQVGLEDLAQLDLALSAERGCDGQIHLVGQYNESLWLLIQFMRAVVYGKTKAFKIFKGKHCRKAIRTGKPAMYFRDLHNFVEAYSRDRIYAPHLQLFFDCYRKHHIRHCVLNGVNRIYTDDLIEAEVFNDFIECMRAEGDQIGIKRKVADWEGNWKENTKRLHRYVNAQFAKCARLVVVRIDFLYKVASLSKEEVRQVHDKLQALSYYDQVAYLKGDESVGERETLARIDISEAMKDRDHLFRNMRGKPALFQHLRGFVWSLEWSRVGGYHLHCAFFFDGSQVQKHEYLGDQIGEYWVDTITRGRGLYHNCNRGRYKHYAVGRVESYDHIKRGHLMRSLEYLAKKDQIVYVKPAVKCKLFSTGHMPPLKSGVGRPRKEMPDSQVVSAGPVDLLPWDPALNHAF